MVRPSQRREMARWAVTNKAISIRQACAIFEVSETCYRYQAKAEPENAVIADWLVRLVPNLLCRAKTWGSCARPGTAVYDFQDGLAGAEDRLIGAERVGWRAGGRR